MVYLRHSPGDNQTHESQEAAIRNLVKEKNWIIDGIFRDAGISGKSVDIRKDFKRMVYLAKQKPRPADLLVIWDLSRFSRDQIQAQLYRAQLRSDGWQILSMNDEIPYGPLGHIFESLTDWKNEQYLIDLHASTIRGLRYVAERGCIPVGAVCHGYTAHSIQIGTYRDGRLRYGRKPEIDPKIAPLVVQAFEMKAQGAPHSAISEKTGLFQPLSGSWEYLFGNRAYIGEFELQDKIFTNIYPAIITKELFEAVQKRLPARRAMKIKGSHHPRRKGSTFFMADRAVALVVSERSQMFQAQKDGLIDASHEMFHNWSLSRMGAPFEQLLVSDLARPGIPHYKLCILADAYYLSADDRELIGRMAECDGATILWFYAPGFLDDRSAELSNMEAVTGIYFGKQDIKDELNVSLSNYDHPVTAGLPQGMSYGTGIKRDLYEHPPRIQFLTDIRVSLVFYADDPQVFVLGLLESIGKTCLLIKDFGTWRSIYSAAPVLSWTLLRNNARGAGVHLYNDISDMVWCNDRFLAVYFQSEGIRPIFFPRAVNVEGAYRGTNLGIGIRQLDLTLKQWETRLLLFRI